MGILKTLFVTNLLLLLLAAPLHSASTYNVGNPVPLFVSKIGPLHNPSETYRYYELAFCHPDQVLEKKESLGELLNGDRLTNALYELEFSLNKTRVILCQQKLNRGDVAKFRDAIKKDFYCQMYYDDLPLWAFIGKVEDGNMTADGKGPKYFLFTHIQFDALYNGNQVIEIQAFSDPSHVVDVTEDADLKVDFTYSVFWSETSTPYKNRMDRYAGASLLPIIQKTHWFSFLNSIITIILLMGLLTILFTRHLKNDLRKWSIGDEDEEKEVGRKHTHGHAFRCPKNLPLFSALLGCGTQLLTMVFILFLQAFLGVFYPYGSGALSSYYTFTAFILTSAVAGYRSASFCSQVAETGWERSAVLAGTLFLGPLICMAFFLNMLAVYFGVTAALPLGTILLIFLMYILVASPLLVLGGVVGHHYKSLLVHGGVVGHHYKSDLLPSPVAKKFPREIPSLSWYRKTPAQMLLGGLLPFSAIVLELHNLCATIWGYKIYTFPGILFVTFVILVVLTALLSVVLTYFQLAAEDPEWWWRSVLRGGATAIFMFAYCIYFYFKSNMSGILQTSFFFGYSACWCYAFFLMLGTVSFQASLVFVRRIYHADKRE